MSGYEEFSKLADRYRQSKVQDEKNKLLEQMRENLLIRNNRNEEYLIKHLKKNINLSIADYGEMLEANFSLHTDPNVECG